MTKELKLIILVVGIVLVALVSGFFLLQNQEKYAPKVAQNNLEALNRETPNVKGNKDSKIVVTEFADLQCPACSQVNPAVDQLVEQYKDKVKFVYRHFPLNIHPNAKDAAYAAEAAGAQGKFFEMVDLLYQKQSEWSTLPDPTGQFLTFASDLGLNQQEYQTAFSDNARRARVSQDAADGNALGVSATPTFFFNDEQITVGGIGEVRKKIEEALKPQ